MVANLRLLVAPGPGEHAAKLSQLHAGKTHVPSGFRGQWTAKSSKKRRRPRGAETSGTRESKSGLAIVFLPMLEWKITIH